MTSQLRRFLLFWQRLPEVKGARRRSAIPPRSHKCNIPAQLSHRDVLQAGGPGSRSRAKSTSSPPALPKLLMLVLMLVEMESSNRIRRPLLQVEPSAVEPGRASAAADSLSLFITKRNSLPDGERSRTSGTPKNFIVSAEAQEHSESESLMNQVC